MPDRDYLIEQVLRDRNYYRGELSRLRASLRSLEAQYERWRCEHYNWLRQRNMEPPQIAYMLGASESEVSELLLQDQCISLFYIERMQQGEIGKLLNISQGQVSKLITNGLKRVRLKVILVEN